MPPNSSEILELVGLLHEGIADEGVWDRAFEGVMRMTGMNVFLVGTVSNDGRDVHFQFGTQSSTPAVSILEGPLADPAHNPWISLGLRHPLRRPATVEDIGGQAALEKTRIWSELYTPFGITDSMGATIERQPGEADIMMIGRLGGKPAAGLEGRDAFATLLPHIARAWRVRRVLGEWQDRAGTLELVLDRLERAIVVTGPEGEVRFANRAADALLSRGDGIDVTRGRIRGSRSRDTEPLLALIGNAAQTSVGGASMAVDAMSITPSNHGAPLAIVAEPLSPAHGSRLGHAADRGAILFISDSEASNRPSADRLATVYALTAAEGRVASLAVAGHSVASVAEALGVSLNTAKYHLKSVFEKVGVSRQPELVRRALADVGGLAEPEKMVPSGSTPSRH